MYFFFGNICMCYFAAAIATLFFESPFIGLEKIIFGRTSSLDKDKKPLTTSKENDLSRNSGYTNESLESEKKSDSLGHAQNGNFSSQHIDLQRSSYKVKLFDEA